jgi:hypothetical protein
MGAVPNGLEIVHASPDFVVATFRNILIQRVTGEVTLDFIDKVQIGEKELLREYPEGYATIVIGELTAKLPSPEVRKKSMDLWKKCEAVILCQALIVRGDGFWASAVRAFMTGVYAVGRTRMPKKSCDDALEAAVFVVDSVGAKAGETASIASAVEAVCAVVRVR